MRLLFVEDNEVSLKAAKSVFNILFHEIDFARNGKEAIELWREHRHQIVITDLYMPAMSGFDLIKEIRESSAIEEYVYIIALTSDKSEKTMSKVYHANVDDYMVKPLSFSELRYRIMAGKNILREIKKKTAIYLLNEMLSMHGPNTMCIDEKVLRRMVRYTGKKMMETSDFRDELKESTLTNIVDVSVIYNLGCVFTKSEKCEKTTSNLVLKLNSILADNEEALKIIKEVILISEAKDTHYSIKPISLRIMNPLVFYLQLVQRDKLPHELAINKLQLESGRRFDPKIVKVIRSNASVLARMIKQ